MMRFLFSYMRQRLLNNRERQNSIIEKIKRKLSLTYKTFLVVWYPDCLLEESERNLMCFLVLYVSEVPKGKKIARWFTSYISKFNNVSPNIEVRLGLACCWHGL